MKHLSTRRVETNFRQHATRAVAAICVVLGIGSVLVPLFYGINPWTGVIFTLVSIWAYQQSTQEKRYRLAAISLVSILALSSVIYAIVHGVYGALAFFLVLLSSLVASLTLSEKIGVTVLVGQAAIIIPIALVGSPEKMARYQATPVLPDTILAVAITAVFYWVIRMFSGHLTLLQGREHAHKKELQVYSTQMETVLEGRLNELEEQITLRTKRLQELADRGKELSTLSHDVSNALSSLRLTIDQHLEGIPTKERGRIEESFNYLRTILQDSRSLKKEEKSDLTAIVTQSVRLLEKQLRLQEIDCEIQVENVRVAMRPAHLQRIVSNLLQNAMEALEHTTKRKRKIRIIGEWVNGEYLLLVHDNANGIAEHLIPIIKEPWFSTKGDQHMGMGLTGVYELLGRYPKASLALETKEGHFTKFVLRLPT